MTHAILICEGRCNPTVRELDRKIPQERRDGQKMIPLSLISQLEHLQYQPHDFVRHITRLERGYTGEPAMQAREVWACVVCGAERIWG